MEGPKDPQQLQQQQLQQMQQQQPSGLPPPPPPGGLGGASTPNGVPPKVKKSYTSHFKDLSSFNNQISKQKPLTR